MANDIHAFQADLKKFGEAVGRIPAVVTRYVTLKVLRQLVAGEPHNPVDTGWSRSNWNVAQGAPDTSVRGKRPVRKKGQTGEIVPPPPEPNLSEIDGKRPVFVTNSVDYVRYLEDGSSMKAPRGFIKIGLAKVEAEVDAFVQQAEKDGFQSQT